MKIKFINIYYSLYESINFYQADRLILYESLIHLISFLKH